MAAANMDTILLRVLMSMVSLRRLGPHLTNCLGGRCGLAFGGQEVYRIGRPNSFACPLVEVTLYCEPREGIRPRFRA